MATTKDTVFFAHSFEKEPIQGSHISDHEVAVWFEKLLKKKWTVISGKVAEARPIDEKVTEAVNNSKALIAIFTRRHKIADNNDSYLSSPWLLCECAYARGLFRHHDYIVAGFREKGIDANSLGMISAGGMEFPEFEREYLDRDKHIFINYLEDLEKRIQSGPLGQGVFDFDSYTQNTIHKIFLIYRNGFGTVHNIVDIVIKNAEQFMTDNNEKKIYHRIWTHFGDIPDLSKMLCVPVHKRKNEAFFHGILQSHKNSRIETYLDINEEKRTDSSCKFSIRFLDPNRNILRVKANDTIRYQYAWGIPNMFPVIEEDLASINADIVDSKTYCLAELDANHGRISNAKLELRFEREVRDGRRCELFSKSPFGRLGRGQLNDTMWGNPFDLQIHTGNPDEFDMWYERYIVSQKDLDKRMSVAWRPSNQRHQL